MRLLITGGAGYIGSHVVALLLEKKHELVIVDNLEKGNRSNLFSETQLIQGNIQDESVLENAFSKPIDAVFHFAAWKAAGESMTDPSKYALNNINGTLKLLTFMEKAGTNQFIFSSSAAVYGSPEYLPIDEKHPVRPENYYGYTKLAIEQNLKWYETLKGFKFAALRYFNAAGYDPKGRVRGLERTPANLLPIIMEAAVGIRKDFEVFGTDYETPDGSCVRDYIHVTDLAKAHVLSLDYLDSEKKSLTVNLGSEKGYSVLEMVRLAEEVVGRSIPHKISGRRAGDPAKLLASSAMAQRLLQWVPEYSEAKTLLKTMWDVYQNPA
ncbi:UDP-glucose 4-epimerase GalE [Leptospira interrogans]|uniref:UDP-glucose 4-epimerase n=7 Tax=Leptospira interrogans TaxID=173 RepID=Q8EZA7_LEPIN|nr:UDP-glucose 4-epimerase [Leptospira interrogans serovar Lai str. 56601]AAS71698.1 UDP-glucose 4-epimerase [Leptospira interrogans serovar Copenhageni str. Fiocruz L1-130]AER03919.1 UDP-glucose 4-epimerase [Leptospira interrogans serovar Lai str. IPAV]AKH78527.1 UDP-glucose 4-epimerase [Leptospira interrogans serovar Bratislava]AKP24780.1 UDP-glucose 4-epimerase [Leptospira interrogans serovar Manilae]ALE41193.1 UDP-glucose 4-epimerase [Leptospira interrogans serovar Hardjo str. Norma]ALO01